MYFYCNELCIVLLVSNYIHQVNGVKLADGDILFSLLSVCVSMCLCTLSPVFNSCRIVCREKYTPRVWKVDNISVQTRYCWKCHFIGFLMIQSGSRSKWGFRRNVHKCYSFGISHKMDLPQHAMQQWRHGDHQPVHSRFIDCGPVSCMVVFIVWNAQ